MSYILEALKKSQQERDAITAEHPPVFIPAASISNSSKSGAQVFALLVGILLLAIIVFLAVRNTATTPLTAPVIATEKTVHTKVVKTEIEPPVMLERAISPREIVEVSSSASAPIPVQPVQQESLESKTSVKVEERRLPALASLRKIPALVINSHIYSSLPSKRSVTINNRSQREGDYLSSDVLIKEITTQGIVIEVDGWPLNISRQQGWQPIPEGS